MIPKNEEVTNSWDGFEGASTYEYAQRTVPVKNKTVLETKK
jgi:hypothetical protein